MAVCAFPASPLAQFANSSSDVPVDLSGFNNVMFAMASGQWPSMHEQQVIRPNHSPNRAGYHKPGIPNSRSYIAYDLSWSR